jgi:hypothetical protein
VYEIHQQHGFLPTLCDRERERERGEGEREREREERVSAALIRVRVPQHPLHGPQMP